MASSDEARRTHAELAAELFKVGWNAGWKARAATEAQRAVEQLAEWTADVRAAMASDCTDKLRHCTCVGVLQARVRELERKGAK